MVQKHMKATVVLIREPKMGHAKENSASQLLVSVAVSQMYASAADGLGVDLCLGLDQ